MKRDRSSSSASSASYVTAGDSAEHSAFAAPATFARPVSPPPPTRRREDVQRREKPTSKHGPTTAEVEAGQEDVEDHVAFFSTKLAGFTRPLSSHPRLSHSDWLDLYRRNQSPSGHHFVVHQHDHPIAGTHYDLRLQVNATSSISFAIMYGLPGDPNSRRLNRNATETRVHCLWNHLIETASPQTGTMLIWDTGEYEALEKSPSLAKSTSDTDTGTDDPSSFQSSFSALSEPEKLASAFSYRKIRLRLHGTRLPPGYTLYIRLTKDNDRTAQPKAPAFKRRRKTPFPNTASRTRRESTTSTSSSSSTASSPTRYPSQSNDDTDSSTATRNSTHRRLRHNVSSLKRKASPPTSKPRPPLTQPLAFTSIDLPPDPPTPPQPTAPPSPPPPTTTTPTRPAPSAFEDNPSSEEEHIRLTNAYPGALNSVNSIHQRKWYLSLDRTLSGFVPIATPSHLRRQHHARTWWVPLSSLYGDSEGDGDAGDAAVDGDGRGGIKSERGVLEVEAKAEAEAKKTRLRREKQARGARGFEKFHVLGREVERSVITGRRGIEILADEGVEGFVGRGGWRGVVE